MPAGVLTHVHRGQRSEGFRGQTRDLALDTLAGRIGRLRSTRDLQDVTGGITAFIPWPFRVGEAEFAAGHLATAGVRNQCDVPEMVRLIRAAGRTPVQRDALYGEVRRY